MTKLTIELVPSTAWGKNLRSDLLPHEWERCKAFVRVRSGSRCEVCGGRGLKWPVECHEVWDYEVPGVQRLVGLIALCPDCHECKHVGFAQVRGRYEQAKSHLMRVNAWSREDADNYLDAVWEVWQLRSQREWALDVSWLQEHLGMSIGVRRVAGRADMSARPE